MIEDLSLNYLLNVPSRQADDAEMPLVVLIHGRGADAHDLYDLAPLLDVEPGCRFVLPNAPEPFEPFPGTAFGWTWFQGWPPEHASILRSRERMLRFLEELTTRYPTPDGKLILAGFSQGALMALDAGLRYQAALAGIVALSGGLYDVDLPDLSLLKATPVFIGHGTADDVVPPLYAMKARRTLEQAGFSVDYHEYPMAHQIVQEEIDDLRGFLGRSLQAG